MMDLRKIDNYSVFYPRNKMAFETPSAPGGLHFLFGPSGVKCPKITKNNLIVHNENSHNLSDPSTTYPISDRFLIETIFQKLQNSVDNVSEIPAVWTEFLGEDTSEMSSTPFKIA